MAHQTELCIYIQASSCDESQSKYGCPYILCCVRVCPSGCLCTSVDVRLSHTVRQQWSNFANSTKFRQSKISCCSRAAEAAAAAFIYIPANQSASNTLAHSVSLRSSTVDVLICAINCQLKHKRRFSIYLIYLAPNLQQSRLYWGTFKAAVEIVT